MKAQLLILFLLLTQILAAQTFTAPSSASTFAGVGSGSIAFSDVNGDGYEDVLITGSKSGGGSIAKLYTNDGSGNFTEMMGTPFEGVKYSSIAFSDVNDDGHQDVLITGEDNGLDRITKLYTNDGLGNFTEMTGTPFEGVYRSSIAFSDVNGDGHQDVLITGRNNGHERIAKLYINDGLGNFTEMIGTPFVGVYRSSIAFSDVNGDGHQDVLITGVYSSVGFDKISKLYTNDGSGNFTEMMDTPFESACDGSIAFSDVNGDGHEDVLITGKGNGLQEISKLYTNDGSGNFAEMMDTPFEGVYISSIAFSDVNDDGHEDVLITGQNNQFEPISKLYINDGSGNFTEKTDTPFGGGVYRSSIAFSDVNGDGHEDVLITGVKAGSSPTSRLYINNDVFSTTAELKIGHSLKFLPFPNPSTSSTLFVQYNAAEMGEATIKVYNLNGVLQRQQSEFITRGQQILPIDISSLNAGTYLVELQIGEKRGAATFVVQ